MTPYSATLQAFIEALLTHHRAHQADEPLRLHLLGTELLVISHVVARRQVRLSSFVTMYGRSPVKNLEIVFFVNDQNQWIPYQYYRPPTDNHVCGGIDAGTQKLVIDNPSSQRSLARQCTLWAVRLKRQGWLEQGMVFDTAAMGVDGELLWPEPTVDEPDEDQLEAWLMDVELCEATDGCLVEVDGMCPHGHPSWLRRLGLV